MTTYRTKDGIEYERYEKFTIKWIATLYWIPLLVGENRVRYFESSQLVEVKSPFDSGMVYCYPAIPQNFDSGLVYTVAEPPQPLVLEPTPELVGKHWQLSVTRDDPLAVAMYHRHYSYAARGRKPTKFGNPGHYIALMTLKRDALWLWSKEKHRKDGQTGVNCAVFRNEGSILSSELIAEAVEIAQRRWPGERLFTFVDASKVASKNPGYCFKQAGWKACGKTGTGLLIFEWKRPTQLTVQMSAELLKHVDAKLSLGVRVIEQPTLYHESMAA